MKYLIFLALLYGCQSNCKPDMVSPLFKAEPTYNLEKDKMVNGLIDAIPSKTKKWNNVGYYCSELFYPEYKITIIHKLAEPFEHKEEWHFLLNAKDGTDILIDESNSSPIHLLNAPTYTRLRQLIK